MCTIQLTLINPSVKDYKIIVSLSDSFSTDDLLSCVKADGIKLCCNHMFLFILLAITLRY